MTDSEKLLVIVDHCRKTRSEDVERCREELQRDGWNAEVSLCHARFDAHGTILELAGHPDDLSWPRDALGARTRIGGSMPQ